MASFVSVPVAQLEPDTLGRLLEEFCSRDGTDYGLQETPLEQRVRQLHARLERGDARLLFDVESESWDILSHEEARVLLGEA